MQKVNYYQLINIKIYKLDGTLIKSANGRFHNLSQIKEFVRAGFPNNGYVNVILTQTDYVKEFKVQTLNKVTEASWNLNLNAKTY